jgi:hypothetical protein
MKIVWVVVCVICLAVGWLSTPHSSPAADTSLLCTGMGDSIWDQQRKGILPKNADTIIKVLKIANDCPQLKSSMEYIAYEIKAYQEKKAHAHERFKKRVEAPAASDEPAGCPFEIVGEHSALPGCL